MGAEGFVATVDDLAEGGLALGDESLEVGVLDLGDAVVLEDEAANVRVLVGEVRVGQLGGLVGEVGRVVVGEGVQFGLEAVLEHLLDALLGDVVALGEQLVSLVVLVVVAVLVVGGLVDDVVELVVLELVEVAVLVVLVLGEEELLVGLAVELLDAHRPQLLLLREVVGHVQVGYA